MKITHPRVLISQLIISIIFVSSLLVLIGGTLYLIHHGHDTVSFQKFQGEPVTYTSFMGICKAALSLSARGLIELGLLFMVMGQAIRVLLTLILFALEKDKIFILISLFILIIMIYSLFFA